MRGQTVALLLGIGLGVLVAQDVVPDGDPGDDPAFVDVRTIGARSSRDIGIDELTNTTRFFDINGVEYFNGMAGFAARLPYFDPTLTHVRLDFNNSKYSDNGGMEWVRQTVEAANPGTTGAACPVPNCPPPNTPWNAVCGGGNGGMTGAGCVAAIAACAAPVAACTASAATAYNNIPIVNRAADNLGGMGPNNGQIFRDGQRALVPGDKLHWLQTPHPYFIRMNDVVEFNGSRIGMRIDNISIYQPANPRMTDFHGFNFQINLRPLYNRTASTDAFQPFSLTDFVVGLYRTMLQGVTFLGSPLSTSLLNGILANTATPIGELLTNFVETSFDISLLAQNSNLVSLYYQFFDQDTGAPVELDEFSITFYDFDQDHADGGKAYIRESMYVSNFTTMFTSNNTELEFEFSPEIAARMQTSNPAMKSLLDTSLTTGAFASSAGDCNVPAVQGGGRGVTLTLTTPSGVTTACVPAVDLRANNRGGIIPMRTVVNWPWSEDRRRSILRPAGWETGSWPPMNPDRCQSTGTGMEACNRAITEASFAYTMGASGSTAAYNDVPREYIVSAASDGSNIQQVFTSAVIVRSTKQGEGVEAIPKLAWIGCQGQCADGLTPAGAACDMGTLQCQPGGSWSTCSASDSRCPGSPQWTGCGFRYAGNGPMTANTNPPVINAGDAAGIATAQAAGWGNDMGLVTALNPTGQLPVALWPAFPNVAECANPTQTQLAQPGHPGLYDDNVRCILDCPRTTVRDDYGNPSDALALAPQHSDRSVTFLFRQRQNFTVVFRTEIGRDTLALMNAGNPAVVRNDLVSYDATVGGKVWRPDLYASGAAAQTQGRERIDSNLDAANPRGRNFLVSGFSVVVPAPPPPSLPPPSPPPSPPPPPCGCPTFIGTQPVSGTPFDAKFRHRTISPYPPNSAWTYGSNNYWYPTALGIGGDFPTAGGSYTWNPAGTTPGTCGVTIPTTGAIANQNRCLSTATIPAGTSPSDWNFNTCSNARCDCPFCVFEGSANPAPSMPPPSPPPPSPPPPSPSPPPPSPPPPSPPPPIPISPCPFCYHIKWNNNGNDYREIRPVFPVDQVPNDHPLITTGLNAGTPPSCRVMSASMSWFWWDFNALSANAFLTAANRQTISMPGANAFYAYSYPYSWSANTGRETANTINMFFLQDTNQQFFHFYILDKAWDGSGGEYKMTLSAMDPVVGISNHPQGFNLPATGKASGDPLNFHDLYTTAPGEAATAFTTGPTPTQPTTGTLPIMLRDDPWNAYTYDALSGRYNFHWRWLECCTDGMVLGPMPSASHGSIGFNVTYEANCTHMTGLEQGTRISMWNPLGPAYNPGSCIGSPLGYNDGAINGARHQVPGVPRAASWIHYDVPMDQTCHWTSGIQLSATPCHRACQRYTNCGECNSQMECGWNEGSNTCEALCAVSGTASTHTIYGETCSVCSSKTNAHECMCEPGCGWAPLDNRTVNGPVGFCISGTPDYPSNQTVTVVQWETKGCPADCTPVPAAPGIGVPTVVPPTCCPRTGPKSQCYRAAYNEKSAFANVRLMDEYGVMPATSYHATHPKVTPGVGGAASATAHLPALDMWSRSGATSPLAGDAEVVNGSVAFMAYGTPNRHSSNSGYEADNSMVTFLVQGDDCQTYLLVLVDRAGDGSGGYLQMSMTHSLCGSAPITGAPVAFLNDPQSRINTYDSYTDSTGIVSWEWDACCNDGMVLGPAPYSCDWSIHMQVLTHETRGLDTFKIGTYDSERNEVGFVTANIRKATTKWGGLQYDAMECTNWCQRYTDCASCFRDEQCQFSHQHGGCIAADAYIYDFGCARPANALTSKVMHREGAAYARESGLDGFDAAMVMRFGLPAGLDMTCPCAQRYRIFCTIYNADTMEPVHQVAATAPRLDYQYTFIDIPALQDNQRYHAYSYLCVAQGTLGRDDCSPVQIDTFTMQVAPPPPSPPPPTAAASS